MKFEYKQGNMLKGRLDYIHLDKAFDFSPTDEKDLKPYHGKTAALLVSSTLQIEFSAETGRLLFIWGYSPTESWEKTSEKTTYALVTEGEVYVSEIDSLGIIPGAGYRTSLADSPLRYNTESDLLIAGEINETDQIIMIATDTIICLRDNELSGIILHPKNLDN
jgi:hypothetical protein